MHAAAGAQQYQIGLIEERRPWTNQGQIAAANAVKLRQFIEAGLAQQGPDRGEIESGLVSPKRRYRFTKWVMPKFRSTKSKILIEPAGAKSIDGEYLFRLRFRTV